MKKQIRITVLLLVGIVLTTICIFTAPSAFENYHMSKILERQKHGKISMPERTRGLAIVIARQAVEMGWPNEARVPDPVRIEEHTNCWTFTYPPLPWRTYRGKTLPSSRPDGELYKTTVTVYKYEPRIAISKP